MGIATKDVTRFSTMKLPTTVKEHLWLLDCMLTREQVLSWPGLSSFLALEITIIYKMNFTFYSVRPENSNWVLAVIKQKFVFLQPEESPPAGHYKAMQASDASLMLTAISKM